VAGIVVAELLTGHTRTSEPGWLVLGADAVHVAAAALWLGGLAALVLALRGSIAEGDPLGGARLVGRFSTLAVWSVVALAGAGLALAWVEVRAPRALTSTSYGLTLVAKTAAALTVLGVAAYNNRILVPAVTGRRPSPLPTNPTSPSSVATLTSVTSPAAALGRLRRTVRIELAGLSVVLATTALLVNLQPAAEAAGVSGPYSTFIPFGDGQLNLVVDPNRVGVNQIHLYVLTTGGLPALISGEGEIEFRMPAEDIGPIVRRLQVGGPGHYLHTGSELAIPGEWVITVRQRISEFEETSVDIPVDVNP
jgi:copper transport protein